jgi:hypothetical protein
LIFYLCPDHAEPSWGVGLLHWHVALLRAAGFEACVVHEHAPFRPSWCEVDVPVRHLDTLAEAPGPADTLVVPEVLAAHPFAQGSVARRVVFVQAAFLVQRGLAGAPDLRALGYEDALAVLPHVAQVVERFYGVRATLVPPFAAPYFFTAGAAGAAPAAERERRVVLVSKAGYRALGFPDEEIVAALLGRGLAAHPEWSLEILVGRSHRQVAELFGRSMFLVNVNTMESFNATVPEAMAAGCVPFCYEAIGGRDVVVDRQNAMVFANHDAFRLTEELLDWIEHFAQRREPLERLRAGGRATAASFTPAATSEALVRFFSRPTQP